MRTSTPRVKISQCRSCEARGVWMYTDEGKRLLVAAETVDEAELEFDPDGTPHYDKKLGHEAHFITCPDADKWRKGRRR